MVLNYKENEFSMTTKGRKKGNELGKPVFSENLKRKYIVSVYLDDEEIEQLNQWATESKKSRAQFIRDILFNSNNKRKFN